jgi:hypothetical protein
MHLHVVAALFHVLIAANAIFVVSPSSLPLLHLDLIHLIVYAARLWLFATHLHLEHEHHLQVQDLEGCEASEGSQAIAVLAQARGKASSQTTLQVSSEANLKNINNTHSIRSRSPSDEVPGLPGGRLETGHLHCHLVDPRLPVLPR